MGGERELEKEREKCLKILNLMFYNSVKNEGFIRKGSKFDSKTEKKVRKKRRSRNIQKRRK